MRIADRCPPVSELIHPGVDTHKECFVEPKSCRACFGWADSPEKVRQMLKGQFDDCQGCAELTVMRAVVRQHQRGQPRWWVVNSDVVVPIWVVELLQKKPEL